jgi:ectoine hydroxylase-related dioxygenase (phytanoyl-CoA dioxygenase family)
MPTAAPPINTDFRRYHSEGYCVFRAAVPRPVIDGTRVELDRLIAANPDTRPEYLTEPHAKHAAWLELCRHPRVIEAVRSVLGDDLILIMTHLIVKPPRDGKKIGWHQDSPSWPQVTGTDICTAWLAIDRADVGNGCMRIIPRTHDGHRDLGMVADEPGNVFSFRVEVTPEIEARQVPIELEPGEFSLHDSYAVHGSEPNPSDRRRAGFTMRYANSNTVRVDVKNHWAPVFLVSGRDIPGSGYVDLRPGVPLPTLPISGADVPRAAGY